MPVRERLRRHHSAGAASRADDEQLQGVLQTRNSMRLSAATSAFRRIVVSFREISGIVPPPPFTALEFGSAKRAESYRKLGENAMTPPPRRDFRTWHEPVITIPRDSISF